MTTRSSGCVLACVLAGHLLPFVWMARPLKPVRRPVRTAADISGPLCLRPLANSADALVAGEPLHRRRAHAAQKRPVWAVASRWIKPVLAHLRVRANQFGIWIIS